MLSSFVRLIILATLLGLLSGCARFADLKISRMFRSFSSELQAEHINDVRSEAERLLAEGNAVKALKRLQDEIANGAQPSIFTSTYANAISLLIVQGNIQLENEHFLAAGNRYQLALDGYPQDHQIREKIETDKQTLILRIDYCADRLLDSGLSYYRKGLLEEAITVWEKIRQFHPTFKPSEQAIETTRIQLKNLQSFGKDSS